MDNISFKQLKETAQELNSAMGLSPPIEYIRTTKEKLLNDVKRSAEFIREGDEIKESTLELLYSIHAAIGKSQIDYYKIDEKPKKKKEKADIYDCYGKEYDRKSDLCEDCNRKDFCRREYRKSLYILRQIKEGKQIQDSNLDFLKYRYTRQHSIIDALKIGGSKAEIIEMANDLYIQKGGRDSETSSSIAFGWITPALMLVKMVRKHGDFYLMREK